MQGKIMKRWAPRYLVAENGFLRYYDKKSLVGTKKHKVGDGTDGVQVGTFHVLRRSRFCAPVCASTRMLSQCGSPYPFSDSRFLSLNPTPNLTPMKKSRSLFCFAGDEADLALHGFRD